MGRDAAVPGVDARNPALGSEDGQALQPRGAEASERRSRQGPPAPSPPPHSMGRQRARPPRPPLAAEGWGQGGVSPRQLLEHSLSPEQLQPQGVAWGGGCCHRKLEAVLASATGGAYRASPRLRDDRRGRGWEPFLPAISLSPAQAHPRTPLAHPKSPLQGRGGEARLGEGRCLGTALKGPLGLVISASARRPGLRGRVEVKLEGTGSPRRAQPLCAQPRWPHWVRPSPGGCTEPELGSRRQASPGEQPDHEGVESLWARTSRCREQGSVGRRGQDNICRAPGPGTACTQPRPRARLWPHGVPGAGGTCGHRGPSRRGRGASAPRLPWYRPRTRESNASGQGTH